MVYREYDSPTVQRSSRGIYRLDLVEDVNKVPKGYYYECKAIVEEALERKIGLGWRSHYKPKHQLTIL